MPPVLLSALTPVKVRLSGKRKEALDDPSLMSRSDSARAVRRKSGDDKTSSDIPQRDGTDEKPLTTPTLSETQEGALPVH